MSIIEKLASAQNRKDEEPNIVLAQEIAASDNTSAVTELVENLNHEKTAIRHDIIKALYEIGAVKPALIADHVLAFINLLKERDNRMVWGAMTALDTIAAQKASDIWKHIDTVMHTTEMGSVITQDHGIRVLAFVSAASPAYEKRIFPFLVDFLKFCRPKDLPRHSESVLVTVNAANHAAILEILETRKPTLRPTQSKRVEKVMRQIRELK